MIVPYYSCLLLGHRYSELQLDEQAQEIMKDYLQEYFTSERVGKISVAYVGLKNTQIIARIKNIIHMLITNLSISVFEVNDSYTLSEEVHAWHEALKELTVRDGQSAKTPAIIQNLSLLKKYFTNYRSENQMKAFLKSLLIQEISHEKRCITYRQTHQIMSKINQEILKIKGEIIIDDYQLENSDENDITIVLINQKSKQASKLEVIIRQVQAKFKVNKSKNNEITQQFTLQYLRKNARNQMCSLIQPYYSIHLAQAAQQAHSLNSSITLIANLQSILKFGFKLAEEEMKLRQQFLAFVQEMRVKYTNQLSKYFQTVRQLSKYQGLRQEYTQRVNKQTIISTYLLGFGNYLSYQSTKQLKIFNQCKAIQSTIRGFLIKQKQYNSLNNAYLLQKRGINQKYQEFYNKVIALQNQNQVKKIAKFNRYKYGFSCCIFIIDIANKVNCIQFQPSAMLRFFEKIARSQQPCTKIQCSNDLIEAHTIEGRVFTMGEGHTTSDLNAEERQTFSIYDSNKENMQISSNSSQSIIHQFDSEAKSMSSLANSLSYNSIKCMKPTIKHKMELKQKSTRILAEDYQFRLQQGGKLFGKGCNKFGQLGLEQQYIDEFTLILGFQNVKLVASGDNVTIIMTTTNKFLHFGSKKGRLPQTRAPRQLILREKFIAKQIVIGSNDIYFLTNSNKVYSLQSEKTLRIPKEMKYQFDHFHLIKTGDVNMEVIYLIAFWINSLDHTKRQEIQKYLTCFDTKPDSLANESILVENVKSSLATILEQSSF